MNKIKIEVCKEDGSEYPYIEDSFYDSRLESISKSNDFFYYVYRKVDHSNFIHRRPYDISGDQRLGIAHGIGKADVLKIKKNGLEC